MYTGLKIILVDKLKSKLDHVYIYFFFSAFNKINLITIFYSGRNNGVLGFR